MNLWEEAEQELADTFDPTLDGSAEEPTPDESDYNGSAGDDDASETSDVSTLARKILENPDTAVDELKRYKRQLDGRHGTDVSRLRQELEVTKAQVTAELAKIKLEKSTPQPDPDAVDENGLTQRDYELLGKVYEKTPQRQAELADQAALNADLKEQVLARLLASVRDKYGDDFTPRHQATVSRLIRKAGYNLQDPDVVAECTEIAEELNSAATRKARQKINSEGDTRQQARSRINATIERPGVTSRSSVDISIKDKNGNITPESMAAAARRMEALIR